MFNFVIFTERVVVSNSSLTTESILYRDRDNKIIDMIKEFPVDIVIWDDMIKISAIESIISKMSTLLDSVFKDIPHYIGVDNFTYYISRKVSTSADIDSIINVLLVALNSYNGIELSKSTADINTVKSIILENTVDNSLDCTTCIDMSYCSDDGVLMARNPIIIFSPVEPSAKCRYVKRWLDEDHIRYHEEIVCNHSVTIIPQRTASMRGDDTFSRVMSAIEARCFRLSLK